MVACVSADETPRLPRLRGRPADTRPTGSLTRRMIGISALWIVLLLGLGGYALDRVLTSAITSNFDRSSIMC